MLDRPYLGRIVGYPGVKIKAAFVDLPGGVVIELLDYQLDGRVPNTDVTANPGNVHLCLKVDDAAQAWNHAVACGATAAHRRAGRYRWRAEHWRAGRLSAHP